MKPKVRAQISAWQQFAKIANIERDPLNAQGTTRFDIAGTVLIGVNSNSVIELGHTLGSGQRRGNQPQAEPTLNFWLKGRLVRPGECQDLDAALEARR